MPRFEAKPIVVEAYRYTGNLADLPLSLLSSVVSAQAGGAAMVRVYYSPRPVSCEPGDWIVCKPGGLAIETNGVFSHAYEQLPSEGSTIRDAVAVVTWLGVPEGDPMRPFLDWQGYRFHLNRETPVAERAVADAIRVNRQFVVRDRQDPPVFPPDPDEIEIIEAPVSAAEDTDDAAGDTEQSGRAGAAQAGRPGGAGGAERGVGDDLHAPAAGDDGAPQIGRADRPGEPAGDQCGDGAIRDDRDAGAAPDGSADRSGGNRTGDNHIRQQRPGSQGGPRTGHHHSGGKLAGR